jgi:hypothetical protein
VDVKGPKHGNLGDAGQGFVDEEEVRRVEKLTEERQGEASEEEVAEVEKAVEEEEQEERPNQGGFWGFLDVSERDSVNVGGYLTREEDVRRVEIAMERQGEASEAEVAEVEQAVEEDPGDTSERR